MKKLLVIFLGLIRKIVDFLRPPPQWHAPVVVLCGAFVGLLLVALHVSEATSYLSDKPEVCMNCHIMAPQYATWQRGSHSQAATCNDCHVPQDGLLGKYAFKAQDGLRHATIFTFRLEPQVIRVKQAGMGVIQKNCIRCHSHTVDDVSCGEVTLKNHYKGKGKLCWECHRETPHGRVSSLASVPYARVHQLSSITPAWMKKIVSKTASNPQK